MPTRARRYLALLACLGSLFSATGCGLLIGNVKPVDEKSDDYGVLDLARAKPDEWTRLDPAKVAGDDKEEAKDAPNGISDAIYQNRKSAATISLNSACRRHTEPAPKDLHKVTQVLLNGITDVTLRDELDTDVNGIPALQTTIKGKLNRESVMLRTVVLQKSSCTYDLVYLSPPDQFSANSTDFAQFVASLKLR